MKRVLLIPLIALTTFITQAQPDVQKAIITQFIEATNGSTIQLPAGTFHFDASLSLDGKKRVKIVGAGMDKTILSFKGQRSGAEGIKITNGSSIIIQDLTVQDTKGDGIKTQLLEGITFINVKAEWTAGPDQNNGGYGLYPVQCTNVLIDGCVAIGASDAGIYVGQSKQIVVKNSKAMMNVAGIEIENSLYADVFDNVVTNNTGGILVFDLPDLIQKEGGYIRVFRNNVFENNHTNFAPKGNIVGRVPPGTGVMVLATRHVEIFENQIKNNITASTSIISYYMTENPINDAQYRPFPSDIFIHHNNYERPHVKASNQGRFGKILKYKLKFGKNVPHILYDGIEDDKMKDRRICISNNTNATFANMDAANNFKGRNRDMKPFVCEGSTINPVVLTATK
jgi:parallel beta-helix repeat protein